MCGEAYTWLSLWLSLLSTCSWCVVSAYTWLSLWLSLLSTCSWCVVSALAPLSCGSRRMHTGGVMIVHDCKSALGVQQYIIKCYINASFIHTVCSEGCLENFFTSLKKGLKWSTLSLKQGWIQHSLDISVIRYLVILVFYKSKKEQGRGEDRRRQCSLLVKV